MFLNDSDLRKTFLMNKKNSALAVARFLILVCIATHKKIQCFAL